MNQTTLKEYLHYEPLTGDFTWKKTTGKQLKGTKAGYVHKQRGGYICIGLMGKNHKAHRLAFLFMTGSIPVFVDHDDKDRSNNKWKNLIAATVTINNRNCTKQHNNTSGTTGVSWDNQRNKWVAQIGVAGVPVNLGRFIDIQDAIYVRKEAEKFYGYHIEHGQKVSVPLSVTNIDKSYQQNNIVIPAFKEYLTGTTLPVLMQKYEVSKRLLSWMQTYAIKIDQYQSFIKEQKRQKKISDGIRGRGASKVVHQLSIDGELLAVHSSMFNAAKITGLNQGNISNVITGRQKTTGGFKWQLG